LVAAVSLGEFVEEFDEVVAGEAFEVVFEVDVAYVASVSVSHDSHTDLLFF
jgi:hypothetical protein